MDESSMIPRFFTVLFGAPLDFASCVIPKRFLLLFFFFTYIEYFRSEQAVRLEINRSSKVALPVMLDTIKHVETTYIRSIAPSEFYWRSNI